MQPQRAPTVSVRSLTQSIRMAVACISEQEEAYISKCVTSPPNGSTRATNLLTLGQHCESCAWQTWGQTWGQTACAKVDLPPSRLAVGLHLKLKMQTASVTAIGGGCLVRCLQKMEPLGVEAKKATPLHHHHHHQTWQAQHFQGAFR
jgi:hypothetical protein